MSLAIARGLSIPELMCVLNEKLGLEYTQIRGVQVSPGVSVASLESEVSRDRILTMFCETYV